MIKYLGFLICLIIIIGAVSHVRYYYNNILSFLLVAGGSLGYALLKNQKGKSGKNCGNGVIYCWFDTSIGLIALTAGKWDNWSDLDKTVLHFLWRF